MSTDDVLQRRERQTHHLAHNITETPMSGLYRYIGGLFPQRRDRLGRAVVKALRRRGLKVPRVARVFQSGSSGHAMAWWTSESASIAWADEMRGIVSEPFLEHVTALVLDGRLMEARNAAIGRSGIEPDRQPSWACLGHPLAIRLLRMADADPAAEGFFRRGGVALVGIDFGEEEPAGVIQDVSATLTTSGRHEVARLKVSTGGGGWMSILVLPVAGDTDRNETTLIVAGHTIPTDVAIALPGRRLTDVVDILDGDPRLDAALKDLRIASASSNDFGCSFVLEPARWIPCADPPSELAGWDDATPWIA